MKLQEQLNKMKSIMGLNENELTIQKEPNTLYFFHGGDLDVVKDDIIQRSDRQVFGPGLYLTTNWDRAKKYAKGGRKMYMVSVEKGTEIEDKKIDISTLTQFLKQNLSPKKTQYVLDRANSRFHNNEIPIFIINNILKFINNNYIY
jgi:hypothetical protein